MKQPSDGYKSWYNTPVVLAKHIPHQNFTIAQLCTIIPHVARDLQNCNRLTHVYPPLKSSILLPVTALPEKANTIAIPQGITHVQQYDRSDSSRSIRPLLAGNLKLSYRRTSEVRFPDTQTVRKTTDKNMIRKTKNQTGRGVRRNVFGERGSAETGILMPRLAKTCNFSSDVVQKRTAGNYLRMVRGDTVIDRIAQTWHAKGRALQGEMPSEKLRSQIRHAMTTLPEQGNRIRTVQLITYFQEHSDVNRAIHPQLNGIYSQELSHMSEDPVSAPRVRKTTDDFIIRETKKLTGQGNRKKDVYRERPYSDAGILIPGFAKTGNFSSDVFQKQTAGNYLRILKRDRLTDRIVQTQHTKGKALQSDMSSEKLRSPIRHAITTLPEQENNIRTFQVITHLQEHPDSNRPMYPRLSENPEFSHRMADVPLPDTGQVLSTTDNSLIRDKKQTGDVFGERGYSDTGILITDFMKTSIFSSDVFHKQTAGNYLKIVRRDSLTDRIKKTQHTEGRAGEREMPEISFGKIVPMKDVTLRHAGVRRDHHSPGVINSVSKVNKASDVVLKKPVLYSEDKTSEQGTKNIFTHRDETLSSRNMHVTGSFHELNNIAEKVYNLIETKISTEKERRGIR